MICWSLNEPIHTLLNSFDTYMGSPSADFTQWAAVRTYHLLMRAPPHTYWTRSLGALYPRSAMNGNSPTAAFSPWKSEIVLHLTSWHFMQKSSPPRRRRYSGYYHIHHLLHLASKSRASVAHKLLIRQQTRNLFQLTLSLSSIVSCLSSSNSFVASGVELNVALFEYKQHTWSGTGHWGKIKFGVMNKSCSCFLFN